MEDLVNNREQLPGAMDKGDIAHANRDKKYRDLPGNRVSWSCGVY